MKKLLLGTLMFLFSMAMSAQQQALDVIYLNNGNIVKGEIIELKENISVKIQSVNGEVYEYKMTEVRDIKNNGDPIMPKQPKRAKYTKYTEQETKYWYSAEASSGISLIYSERNIGLAQFNVTNGYRFNEYLKVGLGIGFRYYIVNGRQRKSSNPWVFPIYLDVRGNFQSQEVRRIVPYWSLDTGATIRDGFFVSPTLGLRFGGKRSNILLGVSYTGQSMDTKDKHNDFLNFVSVKMGYEF